MDTSKRWKKGDSKKKYPRLVKKKRTTNYQMEIDDSPSCTKSMEENIEYPTVDKIMEEKNITLKQEHPMIDTKHI